MKISNKIWMLALCFFAMTMVGCSDSDGGSSEDSNLVRVSGFVFDTNNDPIEGAQVTISSDPVTATTDIQGYFFAMVVPGSHTITITKSHLDIYVAVFTCSEGTPMELGNIETMYDATTAATDDDGDGYSENQNDCDDTDPGVHPDAIEDCGDGIDNDCDQNTDCQDSDCDSDPVCDEIEPGDITLKWLLRTGPVTRFEYSGGIVVKMIFYKNILVTGGSGMVQLTASMKEYEDTAPLDQQTEVFDVQVNQAYEVMIEVDVSSWGSCNPGFTHSMIFSSPAAPETSQIDLYAFIDTDTNFFECAGNYAIRDMSIQPYGDSSDGPIVGPWAGISGFGNIEYQVSYDGTTIEEVKLIFVDFSCGNIVSTSGSITFSNNPGWPITEGEFFIQLILSQTLDQEMQIQGVFSNIGTAATGTYAADFNDTECLGNWDAKPATE